MVGRGIKWWLIRHHFKTPQVLSGISTQEFGEVVGEVNLEADQPNFAVLLGRVMLGEEGSPGGGVIAQRVTAATRFYVVRRRRCM